MIVHLALRRRAKGPSARNQRPHHRQVPAAAAAAAAAVVHHEKKAMLRRKRLALRISLTKRRNKIRKPYEVSLQDFFPINNVYSIIYCCNTVHILNNSKLSMTFGCDKKIR